MQSILSLLALLIVHLTLTCCQSNTSLDDGPLTASLLSSFGIPPIIKHGTDGTLVINLALLEEMAAHSPAALLGVVDGGDKTTIHYLMDLLNAMTGISANCALDLTTYLQSILEMMNDKGPACDLSNFNNSSSNDIENECRLQNLRYMAKTYGWIFQVLDANGVVGEGIQHGNVLWAGDWALCRSIDVTVNRPFPLNHLKRERRWSGQYCRARMYIGANPLTAAKNVTSHSAAEAAMSCFKILPIMNYGLCMPRSCRTIDIQKLVDIVADILQRKGAPICEYPVVCEDEKEQYIRDDGWSIFMMYVYPLVYQLTARFISALLVVTAIFGSCYDRFIFRKLSHTSDVNKIPTAKYDAQPIVGKILLSFSMFTNADKLMGTEVRQGDITCLYGLRVISMFWVIFAHTYYYAVMSVTVDNLLHEIQRFPKTLVSQVVMNGSLAVDTFFFLSGFLVSFLWFKRTYRQKGRNIKQAGHWFSYVYHRYLRLTPAYMFILGFHVTLLEYVTDGPFWNPVERERCAKSWWSNALYINNFVHLSDEETCMGWTWFLANDFQFYLAMPLLMITLYKTKYAGYILGTVVLLASGVLHIALTLPNEWPPAPMLTADLSRATFILDYWPEVYVKPYIRCGPYVVGAMVAHFLWKTKSNVKLNKYVVYLGWTLNTAMGLAVVFGLYDYCATGKITMVEHVFYALFGRIAWALCLGWIVFACATGHGGPINAVLSWKAWTPLARITFCAYLIHPILIITYFRSLMKPATFGGTGLMIFMFLGFAMLAYFLSFFVTLLLEQPISHLETILLSMARVKSGRRAEELKRRRVGSMGPPVDSMAQIASESTANVKHLGTQSLNSEEGIQLLFGLGEDELDMGKQKGLAEALNNNHVSHEPDP